MKELRKRLEELGYNRDIEINKEEWNKAIKNEHKSSKSLAAVEHRNEPTFRDKKIRKSIELKNYKNRKYNPDYVAELEHFNPEKRPLSHILVDMPIWLWKNRIKNQGPKSK